MDDSWTAFVIVDNVLTSLNRRRETASAPLLTLADPTFGSDGIYLQYLQYVLIC